MGTFAGIMMEKNAHIPEEKKQEFIERAIRLLQAGGMMNFEKISIFGMEVYTLKKVTEEEPCTHYNYFEEDCWEEAGVDTDDCSVWSNKIGWGGFNTAVVAAYTLQALYTEGAAAVFIDNNLTRESLFTGWINYLFHENYCCKNENLWNLYEMLHNSEEPEYYLDRINWEKRVKGMYNLRGYLEIMVVEKGMDFIKEILSGVDRMDDSDEKADEEEGEKKINFFTTVEWLMRDINAFKHKSTLSHEKQYERLCEILKDYCNEAEGEKFGELLKDEEMRNLALSIMMMDSPVMLVKAVTEAYDKDFWILWDELRDRLLSAKKEDRQVFQYAPEPAAPVSTADIFHIDPDDLAYFWTPDGDVQFSSEMQEWIGDLRMQFDHIMAEEIVVDRPLKWILGLMQYVQAWYYDIFAFNDFLEESMEHIKEQRYLALWKLFENLLHDPKIEEMSNEIFRPLSQEEERAMRAYPEGKTPQRELKEGIRWLSMSEIRNNKARKILRRYMAIVANVPLREQIFGF